MQYGTRGLLEIVRMATRDAHRLDQQPQPQPQPQHAVGTVWMPPNTGLGNVGASVVALPHHPAMQRRGRSDATWEAHKPIIKTLYMDQGRSLKEVMEIMKSKYGLEAS